MTELGGGNGEGDSVETLDTAVAHHAGEQSVEGLLSPKKTPSGQPVAVATSGNRATNGQAQTSERDPDQLDERPVEYEEPEMIGQLTIDDYIRQAMWGVNGDESEFGAGGELVFVRLENTPATNKLGLIQIIHSQLQEGRGLREEPSFNHFLQNGFLPLFYHEDQDERGSLTKEVYLGVQYHIPKNRANYQTAVMPAAGSLFYVPIDLSSFDIMNASHLGNERLLTLRETEQHAQGLFGDPTITKKLVLMSGNLYREIRHYIQNDLGRSRYLGEIKDEREAEGLFRTIIGRAIREGATDVHFQARNQTFPRIRQRIMGDLRDIPTQLTIPRLRNIIAYTKTQGNMDVGERRMGQSGRIPGRALGIGDSVNLRLQVNPSYLGDSVEDDNQPETLAVRILRQSGQQSYDLYRLGFPKDVLRSLEYIVSQPQGIILVTGPTGSGKTTTLYSILTHLNTPDVNIFTIEDPPEAVIEGITQIPVNLKKKQTFNSILVDLLRSDPDIIMVGEMREAIALMTSLNGSNTGHLILTTLHTNSAVDSVSRCTSMLQAVGTDVNVYRNMLGSSVIGIYAQRLVKQICPDCRESYLGNEDIAKALGIDPSLIEREVQLYRPPTYDKPRKPVDQCQTCKDAGWIGVMPIVELWIPQSDSESDDKAYISSGDFTSQQFFDIAKKRGMRTLAGHGILAAMDGSTSLKEIASKIGGLRDQKDLLVVAINNYDPNWKE